MLVKDLMTPNPVHVGPYTSVADAGQVMRERGIRHLPVLDDDGQLVGLVTRTSLARALPGMGTGLTRFEVNYLSSSTIVRDVLISEPEVISEDGAVEEAARIMNTKRISSLLVMRGQELVGIITDTDLFGALLVLMGAQRPGVRATVYIPDRAGELAKVTSAVAGEGGNLSAVGGWQVKDAEGVYGAILKIDNLALDQVAAVLGKLPDVTVADLREAEGI